MVARAAFRKGSLAIRVRDELGEVFADGAFMDAFGVRGKPGISPGQLAMITVLQFADYAAYRVMPRWGVAVVGCGLGGRNYAA